MMRKGLVQRGLLDGIRLWGIDFGVTACCGVVLFRCALAIEHLFNSLGFRLDGGRANRV
jgi:hypothetical protein